MTECLRVFTRFPQTSRVFFGGAHDNGYTSTLNHLQNEGLQDKLTILCGYKDLAHELKSLDLPYLEIQGVFITQKLQNMNFNYHKKPMVDLTPSPSIIPQYQFNGEQMRTRQNPQVSNQMPQQTPPVFRLLKPGVVSTLVHSMTIMS